MSGIDISKNSPVFIIAEAGVNHNGSLELAKKLVDAAKESGVDAVKFQTFKAENVVSTFAKKAEYQRKTTNIAESQLEMIKKFELSYESFVKLKEYCDKKNIIFLSTPFDYGSVDFLEKLVPLYKIGSGEVTNLPFLKYIAKKGKPLILSTGMSTLGEVEKAINSILPIINTVHFLSFAQFPPLTLLHCVSNYPSDFSEVNLKAMLTLKQAFKLPVGYSDHTLGIEIPIAAVALGARIIEKHLTLEKSLPGPDHRASLDPRELKEMVIAIRNIEKAMGDGIKKPNKSEIETMKVARKSLVTNCEIKKGTVLTKDMISIKRPGTGIPPDDLTKVLGMQIKKDKLIDEIIKWEDLKHEK